MIDGFSLFSKFSGKQSQITFKKINKKKKLLLYFTGVSFPEKKRFLKRN